MKKLFFFVSLFIGSTILSSWGSLGHQTVGVIAERHLTIQAKEAIKYYLGVQTLSDVSTWADEVRGDAKYKHTGSRHFLNLPLGLKQQQFEQQVKGLSTDNVYKALLQCERDVKDPKKP